MGASWAVLWLSSGLLGPCWSVGTPKRRKGKKHRNTQWKISNFSLSGLSWKACLGPLGLFWRPLGPSWNHFERLGALVWRLGALVSRLGGVLGPSWPVSRLLGPEKDPVNRSSGTPPPPNRPDRAPGGGVWGGGSISHADDPQGVGGFWPSRAFLEDVLEGSRAVLEASCGPFGPS